MITKVTSITNYKVSRILNIALYLHHYQGLAIKQGIIPELAEEDLVVTKVIGRGAYGDVHEGLLRDRETGALHNVAIKSLKSMSHLFITTTSYMIHWY